MEVRQPVQLLRAFELMRTGILISLIGWILLGLGLASKFFGILTFLIGGFLTAAAGLMLLIVGAIVILLGFYAKFIPGVSELARADASYSIASKLVRVGYVWGLVLIIVGAVLSLLLLGIPIFFLGILFLIVGFIGIVLLSFNLYSRERNTLYFVAAILFIVSIFVPVMGFLAWILLYAALGKTIKSYSAQR
ncbi:MAG: DUF973 family protein [Archaeoglobaceae archaeon]|nr:DUF973 family protein [Archaeoglobaceae archaeon]MDW8013146.1 hypothetical protein [Archaeoglobaceae archaeon]